MGELHISLYFHPCFQWKKVCCNFFTGGASTFLDWLLSENWKIIPIPLKLGVSLNMSFCRIDPFLGGVKLLTGKLLVCLDLIFSFSTFWFWFPIKLFVFACGPLFPICLTLMGNKSPSSVLFLTIPWFCSHWITGMIQLHLWNTKSIIYIFPNPFWLVADTETVRK